MFRFNKFSNDLSGKNLSVCVVDNVGSTFLPVVKRLSKFFGKSYFYSVNQSPYPRQSVDLAGSGFDDFELIHEFWSMVDQFDVIVFPDIYFNDWGKRLRAMGKLVWGGTEAEVLETDRHLFKDELTSVGMPVAPTEYVIGIEALSEKLQKIEDKWIKISYYRGELETFHHIDWNQSKQWVDELRYTMGPLGNTLEFQIEDSITAVAEMGSDGWAINGKSPNFLTWGIEVKDCGYIGKASAYKDLPMPLKYTNDTFAPILQKYNHTGFYSNEVRYTEDGKCYYTDPCMRAGSPPSNVYLEMIDNWDEIIIGGCKGQIVDPHFVASYGVEIILKSVYCNTGYLSLTYPDQYKDNIKIKGSFIQDGNEYVIPFTQAGYELECFGSVVVVGDDLQSTIEQALEIAGSVEGYRVEYNAAALPDAIEYIADLEQLLKITF